MRDKNYRRRQEVKHYNARRNILSKSNLELLKATNLTEKEERIRRRLINKMKTGDLKYGLWDNFDKKCSNKRRRLFQKTVEHQLPSNVFLKRQHVNPQAHGYNGDSEEDYLFLMLHGDYNLNDKEFEFDTYTEE